jgi:hypothetical protein
MSKPTKQQRIIIALQVEGYSITPSGSTKYVKLQRKGDTLWVGKAGAVRAGRTIADSISITDQFAGGLL